MEDYKNDLLIYLSNYNVKEQSKILKAIDFAADAHFGQYRCSGEPFIIHPLCVATMAAALNLDVDTVVASLLHDTIEDTKVTFRDIEAEFGLDVANLVDGVTKMGDFRFATKKERDLANTRKIITSITKDIRIIIIKILDRVHNMSTMEHKPSDKQKAKSFETLHIFAPMANSIGAYEIKNYLEDTSLKYLDSDKYYRLYEQREEFYAKNKQLVEDVTNEIKSILARNGIPCDINQRIKSIYSIYSRPDEGNYFGAIQDLLSLKILLDDIVSCYDSVYYIHSKYNPINSSWRDYISRPNVNKYRALHTSIIVSDNVPLQAQIKTHGMDIVDRLGLCSYCTIYGHNGYKKMQRDLKRDYAFYKSLSILGDRYTNDEEFVFHAEAELSSVKIYIYNSMGDVVALPYGSTVEYYLFIQGFNLENVEYCVVNGKIANFKQLLKNEDIVYVKTKEKRLLLK